MTVSLSWLVNVNVSANTTVIQNNFNNGMLLGVMPTQTSPYRSPPSTWDTNLTQVYASSDAFNADFNPLIAGATTAGDAAQVTRFTWLKDAVAAYFAQSPSPLTLTVAAMEPRGSDTDYSEILTNISQENNNWYGFSICDDIPVLPAGGQNLSSVVMTVVTSGAGTLVAGTELKSLFLDPTQLYLLLQNVVIPSAGTYQVTFYSVDVTTVIPPATFTEIGYNDLTPSFVSSVTNAEANSIVSVPLSRVTISVTNTDLVYIRAGSISIGSAAHTSPYILLAEMDLTHTGTQDIPFFSLDTTTIIAPSSQTGIVYNSVQIPDLTPPQTNSAANTVFASSAPGILTPTTGVIAALSNLRGATNNSPKKLFLDTNDATVAAQVQASGIGSKDLMFFYHSLNLQPSTASSRASLSAANLSRYFVDLFSLAVGSKPLSSMQLTGQPIDPTINTSNIGDTSAGNSNNLIGWNNNVYASIAGIGLMQYGLMSSSSASQLVYLDQVVGSDYIQLTCQADLASYIINQQATGGVLYNDFGIQQVLSVFKESIQKAVALNILQEPTNANYVYLSYAQVSQQDKTNRIYKDLTFNGNFLGRIQRMGVSINLTL